jgi:hypothetical protein
MNVIPGYKPLQYLHSVIDNMKVNAYYETGWIQFDILTCHR